MILTNLIPLWLMNIYIVVNNMHLKSTPLLFFSKTGPRRLRPLSPQPEFWIRPLSLDTKAFNAEGGGGPGGIKAELSDHIIISNTKPFIFVYRTADIYLYVIQAAREISAVRYTAWSEWHSSTILFLCGKVWERWWWRPGRGSCWGKHTSAVAL